MSENKLAKKLKLHPQEENLVLNAPSSFFAEVKEISFDQEPAKNKQYDYVQLFVHEIAELNHLASQALEAVKEDGKLWLCYPKKSSGIKTDITRDKGWDVVMQVGYGAVAAISIDDTWSALRFRPEGKIVRTGTYMNPATKNQQPKRELVVPDYLQSILDQHPVEKEFFDGLAYTHRKEYTNWVTEARKEETRERRIRQMMEMLKERKKGRYV